MTEEPRDKEYLELFKPKTDEPSDDSTPQEPARAAGDAASQGADARPLEEALAQVADEPGATQPAQPAGDDLAAAGQETQEPPLEPLPAGPGGPGCTLRTVGLFAGGGCLLVILLAVVVFAFYQVFVRKEGDDDLQGTPTPSTPMPTQPVALTPSPTVAVAESPFIVPLVSSDDVRVPVALPERLRVGEAVFAVQAVNAPAGAWPDVPVAGDTAAWAYGTVVNYILGLSPTPENRDLLSALQGGESLSLHMSTGLILNFNVDEVTTDATDQAAFFEQVSPRLTLALLAEDPAQRTVVTAAFFDDEAGDEGVFSEAIAGVVGTTVDQGPVRVTVLEAYQVAADEAGLPPGTGYLLVDFAVENVGTDVLETTHFQTFVSGAAGERYPLTALAEQFAHNGTPTEPLAPGETVIGSLGYLVPDSPEGQVQWAFNPLPGSDNWVTVPLPYDLPPPPPTPEPPPPVGFALVTVNSGDVFVDRDDDLLDIGLEIENISDGVVQVTEDDVGLNSWIDGDLSLIAPAPPFPWTIEPDGSDFFQLQFELPSADSALLSVLGYTFSIENLGNE
jgi:hypothetical protein